MSRASIQSAIIEYFQTLALDDVSIVYENQPNVDHASDATYAHFVVTSGTETKIEIGRGGKRQILGRVIVTIHSPKQFGNGVALEALDAVNAHFRDHRITNSEVDVMFEGADTSRFEDDSHFSLMLSIQYRAYY